MELPPAEREAFVARECAADEPLLREATSLLRAMHRVGHLLEPSRSESSAPVPDIEGAHVGPYRIGKRLGAGGMGVVHAAEDTRLGRGVAVKSLPPEFTFDPARRAMLEHEARLLATLNHPNIGAIYGIEDGPAGPLLVLEHVGGPTLAQRLADGPIPMDESRQIARQILLALESAHAAGIVHRDIKPSNVKLPPTGGVKVLDFGIARLTAGAVPGSGSGPIAAGTIPGRLMGTPAYMSPEQARGRAVDRRTDLWAFGCVLYEMLTGTQVFRGETATDTIAAILRAEPEWSRLPRTVSEPELRLLRRCLEKDPDRRLRDAGDARLDLDSADSGPEGLRRRAGWRGRAVVAVGAAAMVVGIGLGVLAGKGWSGEHSARSGPGATTRVPIDLPASRGLLVDTPGGCMAVSSDGRALAFIAGESQEESRLFVRRLDEFDSRELPGTRGAACPTFSPDGKWIAYGDMGSGEIRKIRVSGGTPVTVTSRASCRSGTCWCDNDTIIYSATTESGGLRLIAPAGGAARSLTEPLAAQHELGHLQPEPLPGGHAILFTCARAESDRYRLSIEAVSPATGARRRIIDDASQPRYLPDGELLYYQHGALLSVAFDPERLSTSGEPRRVYDSLAGGETIPRPRYAVSPAGTVAYVPATTSYEATELVWFSLSGSVTPACKSEEMIDSLRLSPDGARVAFAAGAVMSDIWVRDMSRSTTTRIAAGARRYYPIWTPDGRRVAFKTEGPGTIDWVPSDGTTEPETLFTSQPGQRCYPNTFTPDGATLIFTLAERPEGPEDLFAVRPRVDATPQRVFGAPAYANRFGARLSPDGALLAYTSEESGAMEVYLQTYPALDRKIAISAGGGFRSAWSGDGKTLFYRWRDRLYAVQITTAPELTASSPRMLLEHLPESRYDASPDGTRFLVAQLPGVPAPQTRINVILNWNRDSRLDR